MAHPMIRRLTLDKSAILRDVRTNLSAVAEALEGIGEREMADLLMDQTLIIDYTLTQLASQRALPGHPIIEEDA
jgi:hypothetical protein